MLHTWVNMLLYAVLDVAPCPCFSLVPPVWVRANQPASARASRKKPAARSRAPQAHSLRCAVGCPWCRRRVRLRHRRLRGPRAGQCLDRAGPCNGVPLQGSNGFRASVRLVRTKLPAGRPGRSASLPPRRCNCSPFPQMTMRPASTPA